MENCMEGPETSRSSIVGDPEIEALLNRAIRLGTAAVNNMPATPENLDRAASVCRSAVLAQAGCGLWRRWSIASAAELRELGCRWELAPPSLVPGPPIRVVWDFKRTPLWLLQTSAG